MCGLCCFWRGADGRGCTVGRAGFAALLHAVAAWRDAAGVPVRLVALHIHHGLQADADAWEAACARMAAAVGAAFRVRRVRVSTDAGRGIEEAAREARYAALDALCAETGATLLLTAHHLDDQAETVLLQLLRGAGLDGLSAMPMARERRVTLLRPWLDVPRGDIEAYARAHALAWVEDPPMAMPAMPATRCGRCWPAWPGIFLPTGPRWRAARRIWPRRRR